MSKEVYLIDFKVHIQNILLRKKSKKSVIDTNCMNKYIYFHGKIFKFIYRKGPNHEILGAES